MSILARFTPSNLTQEQYDESIARLKASESVWPPDGLEIHVAFGVDGDMRVSEVWESQEKLNAFADRLMPILDDIGIKLEGGPEILPVHNVLHSPDLLHPNEQ